MFSIIYSTYSDFRIPVTDGVTSRAIRQKSQPSTSRHARSSGYVSSQQPLLSVLVYFQQRLRPVTRRRRNYKGINGTARVDGGVRCSSLKATETVGPRELN